MPNLTPTQSSTQRPPWSIEAVSDDGSVTVRSPRGQTYTFLIPLELVPRYQRMAATDAAERRRSGPDRDG